MSAFGRPPGRALGTMRNGCYLTTAPPIVGSCSANSPSVEKGIPSSLWLNRGFLPTLFLTRKKELKMNYRCVCILTVLLGLFDCGAAMAAEKQSIIFIMVDDMGYHDLGCYGSKTILTVLRLLQPVARAHVLYASVPKQREGGTERALHAPRDL